MSDPEAFAALKARANWPNAADSAYLATLRDAARVFFGTLVAGVAGVVVWRMARRAVDGRGVRIYYVDGPTVDIQPGMTLLEASRAAGVRHASVCGGRARCSTCRVRIEHGLESLPSPAGAEAITLQSIEAPPNVRLACQIRPSAPLTVAIVTHPAAPGPIRVEFVEMKEVVAAHVRAMVAAQPTDFRSADPNEVAGWFKRRAVPYSVPARDLRGDGFTLLGGRLDYLLDRPAAALVFLRDAHTITLFVVPAGDDALAIRGQRNGYQVLAWAESDLAYFAVSDLPMAELERLEQCFATVPAQ
jgi:ferredoxin